MENLCVHNIGWMKNLCGKNVRKMENRELPYVSWMKKQKPDWDVRPIMCMSNYLGTTNGLCAFYEVTEAEGIPTHAGSV